MQPATWTCPQAPEPLLDWLQARMAGARGVTRCTRSTPLLLEIQSEGVAAWTVVVAVLLFPIGLLALLARSRGTAVAHAEPWGTGTKLHISGSVSKGATQRLELAYMELFPGETVAVAGAWAPGDPKATRTFRERRGLHVFLGVVAVLAVVEVLGVTGVI